MVPVTVQDFALASKVPVVATLLIDVPPAQFTHVPADSVKPSKHAVQATVPEDIVQVEQPAILLLHSVQLVPSRAKFVLHPPASHFVAPLVVQVLQFDAQALQLVSVPGVFGPKVVAHESHPPAPLELQQAKPPAVHVQFAEHAFPHCFSTLLRIYPV